MPITTERIERGIYFAEWSGHLQAEETIDSIRPVLALAAEDQCERFVIVIDATQFIGVNRFDIGALVTSIRATETKVIARVVINGTIVAQVAQSIIYKLLRSRFYTVNAKEKAFDLARRLLAEDTHLRETNGVNDGTANLTH
ncbi:MAG: hypothetical protein SF162_09995 [bacterium]|nr:hypothetical protein [bacterium]